MARLVELCTQLQSLKKGGMFALDYNQKIKGLCNSLVAIGEPVSREDQLIYMFNGLHSEYNAFFFFDRQKHKYILEKGSLKGNPEHTGSI